MPPWLKAVSKYAKGEIMNEYNEQDLEEEEWDDELDDYEEIIYQCTCCYHVQAKKTSCEKCGFHNFEEITF